MAHSRLPATAREHRFVNLLIVSATTFNCAMGLCKDDADQLPGELEKLNRHATNDVGNVSSVGRETGEHALVAST